MAKKSGDNQSIMRYDEELAKQAKEAADAVAGIGGGEFFSIKDDKLTFGGVALPYNQVGAIVVDFVYSNAFYPEKFTKGKSQQPVCYAFGRKSNEKDIFPHADSPDKKCADCASCEYNVFGSGEGNAKACKNGIRLALIPAGTYESETKFTPFKDPEEFEKQAGYFTVPPTSLKGFGNYVKQVSGSLNVPPHAVFTKMQLKEKVIYFEPIAKAPAAIIPVLMKRNAEVRKLIEFPFPKPDDSKVKAGKGKPGKAKGKKF